MANMKKTIISGALVGTMAFTGIGTTAFDLNEALFPSSTISASAASLYIPELTGNNYIEWYCSNSGQTKVYTSSSFKTRGSSANKNGSGCRSYNAYIDKNDKCYICKMTSKYIFLKYPAGSIYRYGYIRTSDVTGLSQTSGAFKSKAGGIKTYSSSNLGTKIGSIDKNDTIYLLNKKSGNYQLVYSLTGSSSFKIGWVSSGDYNSIKKGSTSSTSNTRQKIVNKALGEVGVAEVGNNNVKYNTWYWGRTINESGYAWCNAFTSWCGKEAGVSTNVMPRTASVATTLNFYKKQNRFYFSKYHGGSYTPKAGDLVFYGSNGTSHIGIIVASPVNGYLQVVEGNVYINGKWQVYKFTNNSNRKLNSSYVYGYASPNY